MKSLLSFCCLCFTATVFAADWPQFLGPNRDGTSAETGWNQNWADVEPEVIWQAKVGDGCASFAIANGRAFTVGNQGGKDVVFCLDAATGEEIWTYAFKEGRGPKFYNGGPSATPTVDGDRVYTVSKSGKLHCFQTSDGKLLWEIDYVADFNGKAPGWGWAAAPLVVGDQLICDPGGPGASIAALNKLTGEVIWKAGDAESGYAAPFIAGDSIVLFQGNGLNHYSLTTGELTSSAPWKTTYGLNASIPIPYNGGYFISSAYGSGSAYVKDGSQTYTTKNLGLHFQNAIRVGDYLYAGDGQVNVRGAEYKCVRLSDGELMWSEAIGNAISTTILVDGKLIILSDTGELILANPSPDDFDEIGRIQVLPKTCWAAPAFAHGKIYVRNNDGRAVCLDVSP